jgi:hypothetical protein
MEVQSVHPDVTEDMKQPAAYDRSDDAQENVEKETFTTTVDEMARDEARDQTQENPNEQ